MVFAPRGSLYVPNFDPSSIDWVAVQSDPKLMQQLIDSIGPIPEFIQQIRDQHFCPSPKVKVKPAPLGVSVTEKWVKKNNRIEQGGIRKKRHSSTSPADRRGMTKGLTQVQYERHAIHLMSRVLSLRSNASPFTLVLDDLNQKATPFIQELMRRGLSRNVNVVVLAFDHKTPGQGAPGISFIPVTAQHTGAQLLAELERALTPFQDSIVIVDSLYDLLDVKDVDINALFSLIAVKYTSSLIGVYHQDMIPPQDLAAAYGPPQLDTLRYMATTVITCKSFAQVLASKAAKERSLPTPTFGLLEGAEGVVQCLKANDTRGIVLEAEFRRKSGRPEKDTYFLRATTMHDYEAPKDGLTVGVLKKEFVTLLSRNPTYASDVVGGLVHAAAEKIDATFELGLTDKQKKARDLVELPYYDAQKVMGDAGEGGRILYDMGEEDDFDEEEDEI